MDRRLGFDSKACDNAEHHLVAPTEGANGTSNDPPKAIHMERLRVCVHVCVRVRVNAFRSICQVTGWFLVLPSPPRLLTQFNTKTEVGVLMFFKIMRAGDFEGTNLLNFNVLQNVETQKRRVRC